MGSDERPENCVVVVAGVSSPPRKKIGLRTEGLNNIGDDDDLIARMAAAAAAGDRQHLLALARELVAASQLRDGDDAEDLLALPVVAGKLTCGTRTVWRLVASGELQPPIHVGGGARWRRKDVQQYLEQRKAKRGKRRR